MASCSDGSASSRLPSPAAAEAAMDARPAAMPAISGTERRKPKLAPDAVASVVAPPGLTVDTRTNKASGVRVASTAASCGTGLSRCNAPDGIFESNAGHVDHYRL